MHTFGSLALTLLLGMVPLAMADGITKLPVGNEAPKERLRLEGAESDGNPQARLHGNPAEPTKSKKTVEQAAKGAAATGNPRDSRVKSGHDMSKSSIGNIKAREASAGVPEGSVRSDKTPETSGREKALQSPDTASRGMNQRPRSSAGTLSTQ